MARREEALEWFNRALARRPNFIETLNNKAYLLGQLHRFDEAFAIYRHLQRSGASTPVTDWNLSLLQMLTGDFEAGWAGREARWNAPVLGFAYPKFTQPMWLGKENIEGKTILLHIDEGLGDSIQFVRYVPEVAARGARVVLVVGDALHPLLRDLPGVSECLPLSAEGLPAFDLHCPLGSLPLAFGTRLDTIPSRHAYLPSPPRGRVQAWEDRLGTPDKLRIGLVWSGNPTHANDHNRSLPLRMMSRILDIDATFVSLQKDPRPDDAATLRECSHIIDLTADLTDFSETAALVSCLDLVITVDTSVAHLSRQLLAGPPGSCCPIRRTIAGCSIATTAPGIRPCGCSGRPKHATTPRSSIGCERNSSPWLPPNCYVDNAESPSDSRLGHLRCADEPQRARSPGARIPSEPGYRRRRYAGHAL